MVIILTFVFFLSQLSYLDITYSINNHIIVIVYTACTITVKTIYFYYCKNVMGKNPCDLC